MAKFIKVIERKSPKAEKEFKAKIPNFLSYFFWDKVIHLDLVERTWNGLGGIISKFVENEFFKKVIAMNLFYDTFNYKNFEFFKGIVSGLGLTNE